MPVPPQVVALGIQAGALGLKQILDLYVVKAKVDKETTATVIKYLRPSSKDFCQALDGLTKNQRIVSTHAADVIKQAMDICKTGLKAAKTKKEREQVYDNMMALVQHAKEIAHQERKFNRDAMLILAGVAVAGLGAVLLAAHPKVGQTLLQKAKNMLPKRLA